MSSERSWTAWTLLVDLVDVLQHHFSHDGPPSLHGHVSLQTWNAGPSAGSTASPPLHQRVAAVQRLERGAAEPAERQPHGLVRCARGEAEQALAGQLAQVGDRVGRDVGVAHAAAGERRARAPQRDERAVAVEGGPSQVSGRPHGIVRRASSPQSPSSPISSPANTIGTPGVVICRPTPTSCRSREPTTVRKRAVSWLSRSVHECRRRSQGIPPRKLRIDVTTASPGSRGSPTGMLQKKLCSSSGRSSPRSQRPDRARGSPRSSWCRASRRPAGRRGSRARARRRAACRSTLVCGSRSRRRS